MTLRNIDTELDEAGVARMVKTAVVVTESVTVIKKPSERQQFLAKPDAEWRWADLRDYVVAEIESCYGPLSGRDSKKEFGIFNSFMIRWKERAVPIARAAFERFDGRWNNEAISIYRFCKNADPYFAAVIAERLAATPVTDW